MCRSLRYFDEAPVEASSGVLADRKRRGGCPRTSEAMAEGWERPFSHVECEMEEIFGALQPEAVRSTPHGLSWPSQKLN